MQLGVELPSCNLAGNGAVNIERGGGGGHPRATQVPPLAYSMGIRTDGLVILEPLGRQCGTSRELLLRQFLDADVAKAHRAVVALQEDRSGLVDPAVNLGTGRPVALHVVVDLDAVQGHGDLVADNGSFGALPFASRLGDELVRGFESVDRTVAGVAGFAFLMVTQYLDLMPATQVKAAVRAVRRLVLSSEQRR